VFSVSAYLRKGNPIEKRGRALTGFGSDSGTEENRKNR
jgi:hypothetical protein